MLMLLSVHMTSVLFLVWFNNFTLTMGFYWSYTLLLQSRSYASWFTQSHAQWYTHPAIPPQWEGVDRLAQHYSFPLFCLLKNKNGGGLGVRLSWSASDSSPAVSESSSCRERFMVVYNVSVTSCLGEHDGLLLPLLYRPLIKCFHLEPSPWLSPAWNWKLQRTNQSYQLRTGMVSFHSTSLTSSEQEW